MSKLPLLQVKNLGVYLKNDPAHLLLKDISFDLNRGETFCLLGDSGSGKSLTALALMRLLAPVFKYQVDSRILLRNQDILTLPEGVFQKARGKEMAIIFQDPYLSLNPVLTIGEQLSECLTLHSTLKGDLKFQACLELLNSVQLKDVISCYKAYPHQLSGGMRQRVIIAMALAARPELLIADEPTTALDAVTKLEILQLLQDLKTRYELALLLITHDKKVAQKMADSVAVIKEGCILEKTSAQAYFKRWALAKPPIDLVTKTAIDDEVKDFRKTLVRVQDLCVSEQDLSPKSFKDKNKRLILDHVSLFIKEAEILAIVGESGSGKTTLARALLGLIEGRAETLVVNGRVLLEKGCIETVKGQAPAQLVFQDPIASLNPRLRVVEAIGEGLKISFTDLKPQACRLRAIALMKKVGLEPDLADRYPHELSGGQCQRVAIARALSVNPRVLICDEVTSSLDTATAADMIKLLQELVEKEDMALLWISHDLTRSSQLAERICVMQNGLIVEEGLSAQIMMKPEHPYTRILVEATIE